MKPIAVLLVAVLLIAGLIFGAVELFPGSDPESTIADATSRIAQIELQLKLRDDQVDFRDVAFRAVDPERKRSTAVYVCGLYRRRGGGDWQRFLWFRTSDSEQSNIVVSTQIGGEAIIRTTCPQ